MRSEKEGGVAQRFPSATRRPFLCCGNGTERYSIAAESVACARLAISDFVFTFALLSPHKKLFLSFYPYDDDNDVSVSIEAAMSQSTKFNVLQPSFGHGNNNNNRLIPHPNQNSVEALKSEASPLQRSTVRKSFKRRLPQQNLPVRDTNASLPPVSTHQSSPYVSIPSVSSSAGRVGTKNSLGPDPPASVARRNARERNRVKQVNTGFAVLRQHIPVLCGSVIVYGGSPHCSEPLSSSSSSSSSSSPPANSSSNKKNKMSKVETLRCAVEYIRNLEKLLATGGSSEMEQDQLNIKEEPLDCLPYELNVAVGSPSIQESRENISPLEIAGLSTSANDLSGFYDSSSSPESQSPDVHHQNQRFLFPFLLEASPTGDVPTGEQKRIKTEQDSAESAALFKQELLRSLSCWNRSDPEQPLPELLLDHPGQTEQQQNSAIQNISDHSLLESLNSWWGSSL